MALSPHALVDLDDLKTELTLVSADADRLLEDLINAATAQIETFTRRRLKARTYKPTGAGAGEVNLKLNGDERISTTKFLFPEYPLNSIAALVIKDADLKDPNTLDVATDLVFVPETGLVVLINGDSWKKGIQNIEATFNAGEVPDDLERAARMLVKWMYLSTDRHRSGISSISTEGQTVSYIQRAMPPDIEFMLQKYVRPLHG
ncbi:hypothetical protein LCGC14_1743690 [marine sediment metagenome]|uniref:Phage gp6-like head-tail connector protein n=1 Tax=marine sediment metagenome TaxID=412755 RepID=A0A0F9K5J3_9ZZZZ